MSRNDIPFMTLAQLADRIRRKELSPLELTDLYLDRIAQLNPSLNAYITVAVDAARAQATFATREILDNAYRGPLHGIPLGIKDQFDTIAIRTTYGSRTRDAWVPTEDAFAVARLKAAGAIVLGKQNMPEFAMSGTLEFPYGTPRNPWDVGRTTGGTSAGSAAAAAAGLAAASVGEDTGGSIRVPAAYCGVTGLKPTWGRVSRHGALPGAWELDCPGPIARSAEDCALLLSAMAGHDPYDRWRSTVLVPDYAATLDVGVRGLRIGVVRELMDAPTEPEVRGLVQAALRTLEAEGAVVEEVSLPEAPLAAYVYVAIADVEAAKYHRNTLVDDWDSVDAGTRVRLMTASALPPAAAAVAHRARSRLRDGMAKLLERYDVLASPTTATVAPKLAPNASLARVATKEEADARLYGPARAHPVLANLHGGPAISVPCGFTSEGMPAGLQFMGRGFDEEIVLRVAHTYQQRTLWHLHRAG